MSLYSPSGQEVPKSFRKGFEFLSYLSLLIQQTLGCCIIYECQVGLLVLFQYAKVYMCSSCEHWGTICRVPFWGYGGRWYGSWDHSTTPSPTALAFDTVEAHLRSCSLWAKSLSQDLTFSAALPINNLQTIWRFYRLISVHFSFSIDYPCLHFKRLSKLWNTA